MDEKKPELEDLLNRIDENVNNFYKNCPYLSDEIDEEARKTFIKNFWKGFFTLCNDPGRVSNCLRHYHQARKLMGEVEFYYPRETDKAFENYCEKSGFSKGEIMAMQQRAIMIPRAMTEYHYCEHLMNSANNIKYRVMMLRVWLQCSSGNI